jgi:hypothetical protein
MTALDRILSDLEAEQRLDNAEAFLVKLRDARDFLPDNDPITRAEMTLLVRRAEYAVERLRVAVFGCVS